MNNWNGIGRLTRDPDVKYTRDGMAIARFSIAIDRPGKQGDEKKTDFPNIIAFGKTAEACEKYLCRGRMVGITGRIQTGSYTNRDGVKVYTTDVLAERVKFIEWGDNTKVPTPSNDIGNGFMSIPDDIDEDLPFM